MVGLLCLREAKEGGKSMLASSVTIYNEMSRRNPDLVKALLNPSQGIVGKSLLVRNPFAKFRYLTGTKVISPVFIIVNILILLNV